MNNKSTISKEDILNELKNDTIEANHKQKEKTRKSKIRRNIVISFVLLCLIVGYVMFRGEYLKVLEIGENYTSIYWQNVNYTAITFGINFVLLYLIFYINHIKIKNNLKVFFAHDKIKMPKLPNKSISFIVSIIISGVISRIMLNSFMLFVNSTSFGSVDPVFGLDIGFFMFQKPFIDFMFGYLLFLITVITVYTAIYYIAAFNIFFDGISRETLKKSKILKQLLNNILIGTFLVAGLTFMSTYNIGLEKFMNLQEDTIYSIYGAGITDTTIKLWGYRILSILIILSVFIAIKYYNKGKTKKVLLSLAVVPSYIICMLVVNLGFQVIFVTPNELDTEKANITANIKYTKDAYGINIDEVLITNGGETITDEQLKSASTTVDNIVLIDKDTLLTDLNALQTEKGYYTYSSTQLTSVMIDGKEQLVYVSPREINGNGTYNNQTYEYTHGYGTIISSATNSNVNGNVVNLQKDFEASENDVIEILTPRIYFGVETNNNIVTNSNNRAEFDYPITDGETDNEYVYTGESGLNLGFFDRFILGVSEGDLKLALSANVNSESKILTNRNIIDRAKAIMPNLEYDENPYMLIDDEGNLIWVLDAYTTSNAYPYSQVTTINKDINNKLEFNYIRNSIKVLIDAYNGTIKFYITDKTDPIASAYQKIYVDLFEKEEIPTSISSQFVYSEYLYTIQSEIIQRYHDIQYDVLYRGDNVWDIATHNTSKVYTKTGTDFSPYYTMVKTVDSNEEQLGLVIPFTPYKKQNIISYMVGTVENGKSKLSIYKYQDDSNILGPMQLDTQIEQDEIISKELESLDVSGTKITKNMIIVPIDNTLLYIEPIFQQYINEQDSVPTLKKVVVASGNKLAIGNDLEEALSNLVSKYAVDIEIENTDSVDDIIENLIKANQNLNTSTDSGDYEMIGKDIQKIQDLIIALEELTKIEKENELEELEESIIEEELNIIE